MPKEFKTAREILEELFEKGGAYHLWQHVEGKDESLDQALARLRTLIEGRVEELKKKVEKQYHHICYAGSTVRLKDFWSKKKIIKCDYKTRYGQGDWPTYACTHCNGISKGCLEITPYSDKYAVQHNQALADIKGLLEEILR